MKRSQKEKKSKIIYFSLKLMKFKMMTSVLITYSSPPSFLLFLLYCPFCLHAFFSASSKTISGLLEFDSKTEAVEVLTVLNHYQIRIPSKSVWKASPVFQAFIQWISKNFTAWRYEASLTQGSLRCISKQLSTICMVDSTWSAFLLLQE